jgi:hypothetical protein
VAQAKKATNLAVAIQIVPGPDSRQAIASQALSGLRKVLYRTPLVIPINPKKHPKVVAFLPAVGHRIENPQ